MSRRLRDMSGFLQISKQFVVVWCTLVRSFGLLEELADLEYRPRYTSIRYDPWFCSLINIYGLTRTGLTFFIPTIVRSYGYSPIQTQLHCAPPYALAWVVSIALAIVSDRIRLRTPVLAVALILCLVAGGILITVHNDIHLEYTALFLWASGTYSAVPIIICWYTMNLSSSWERSVGTGSQIGFGLM